MNFKCLRCQSENLENGQLIRHDGDRTLFRLEKTPWFSLASNDLKVSATLCLNCGHIELLGDLGKARRVLDK